MVCCVECCCVPEAVPAPNTRSKLIIFARLTPYNLSVLLYTGMLLMNKQISGVVKCLPAFSLCLYIIFQGFSCNPFQKRILCGLVFAALGDFILVCSCCFVWGWISIFISNCFYIFAFGLRPMKPLIGLLSTVTAITAFYLINPELKNPFTFPIPIDIAMAVFLFWRAMATCNSDNIKKTAGSTGTFLLVLSDFLLITNTFAATLPSVSPFVMYLYFVGHLGIALSATRITNPPIICEKKPKPCETCPQETNECQVEETDKCCERKKSARCKMKKRNSCQKAGKKKRSSISQRKSSSCQRKKSNSCPKMKPKCPKKKSKTCQKKEHASSQIETTPACKRESRSCSEGSKSRSIKKSPKGKSKQCSRSCSY